MPQYGINQQVASGATVEFNWNGRSGELVVETSGSVKIQRWCRTKYIDIPELEIVGDGSLIFDTIATKLQVVATGAAAEVVVTPHYRG